MDITIREARPDEHPAVGELAAQAYLHDGILTHGTEDPYLATLRDAAGRAAQAELLVATSPDVGDPLGTVTFAPAAPYAQIAAPDEAEFRVLAVSPAARGRGIGEALVHACVERARVLGRRRLVLSMAPGNDAARLYTRLGFTRTPERDWDPVPGLTLVTYALPLER